eukprot:scaffold4_cov396-Prasinococcus_capsulatus_cf.AAC.4
MGLDGAIRSGGLQVSGILGYDVFKRVLLDISIAARGSRGLGSAEKVDLFRRSRTRPPPPSVFIYDPQKYEAAPIVEKAWQPLVYVNRTPHLHAAFDLDGPSMGLAKIVANEQEDLQQLVDKGVLLRLGLGTGGAGIILRQDYAKEIHLIENLAETAETGSAGLPPLNPSGLVTAPGSSRGSFRDSDARSNPIASVRISRLRLFQAAFENAQVLVHLDEDPMDMEMGAGTVGIMGADLWRGSRLVIDGPGNRVSVSPIPYDL